ncbi:MAG TPA: acyltransferase [Thermoanaerobaculia bacterium]|nr:acyltransferase [Thermoanaerobaculia bacterium]
MVATAVHVMTMDVKTDELRLWLEHARRVHEELRAEMRDQFSRDLPLEELLFDRWERARSLGFGEGASIYHNSYVFGRVEVGAGTWVGPFTILDGSGGIVIGDHCSISAGVQIYSHDSVKWALSGGVADYETSPVTIGRACYIGPNSVIARGVTIGDHSVVGAHSFVNRDLPPYSVAFGAPCRVHGHVRVDGDRVELVMDET